MKHIPQISIVGAGPGDPELLTLKAYRLIKEAEAIVFDRLISQEIMDLVPDGVIKIFAGKSCKKHYMTQDEINHTLLSLAQAGKKVVRLKGGDPFIFGRGGEEAQFLAQNGVSFEIVPAVSAAEGCAAYAGIPLSHREFATSIRFITGHSKNDVLDLDWNSFGDKRTTNVFFMGLGTLPLIKQGLMSVGISENTPAAIIENGTTSKQRVHISTLERLPQEAIAMEFKSPCLIVIGEVVSLAKEIYPSLKKITSSSLM